MKTVIQSVTVSLLFVASAVSQTPKQGTVPKKSGDAAPAAAQKQDGPAEAKKKGDKASLTPKFDKKKFLAYLDKIAKARGNKSVRKTFDEEWEMGADSGITGRALRALHPIYRKAMDRVEEGKPDGVLELAKLLSVKKGDTIDPYVRAHARYHLARALLNEDDPEAAAMLLQDFILEDRGKSLLDPEAAFYLGYSLSLIPKVDAAIVNLRVFLELYPDASERYRANAQQLLQELEAQWDSPLHAIADDMQYCERKLRKTQTGKEVETKQLDIVEKLDVLIKQLEQQQQGPGGGPPQGNGPSSGPATESSLPGGEGRVGQLHGSRGVKDRWGSMKDRDRKKILNELQTKLPERYRTLLENYYKRLNK